ncbi:MAG: hypothetical protein LBK69_03520, partial [Syntrophomonadaceae bacterium]|nr:hypothetical protein [Syntrophomonadaceae bacterium]
LSKTCSPTVDSLGKICAVLGLSLEQLFTYTDERTFKRNERDAAILEALHALPDEANDILLAFLKLIASMF